MAEYDDNTTPGLETKDELGQNPQAVVRRWLLELRMADKREREWRKTANGVLDLYRGESRKKNSFNILWSITETLLPAVYSSVPKPDVRRRYKDADPLGKVVSEVLSRSLDFSLDTYDFNSVARATVLDMLLTGRGIDRIRYVPSLVKVGGEQEGQPEPDDALEGEAEELDWEQTVAEHVQWDDFRFGPGKRWPEVPWVGFRHRLFREDLIEKFGEEIGNAVKLDATDDDDINKMPEHETEAFKTAEVWEIWDKDSKQVLFINSTYKAGPLKTLDDPLNLTDFFPCPRPIYAIEDVDSLTPICLYEQYKEQAEELNRISTRINKIVDALKLRGVYDPTISEMSEIMRGNDNDFIPAQNVAALIERGGIEAGIWTTQELIKAGAQVLAVLYQQRDACKQTIYEITGMGDILRGVTNPNETATAQQIKSQWGSLRIKNMQQEVARYLRDILRLKAEIIAEKFDQQTLEQMTLLQLPHMQDVQQQAMQAQQQGQQFQMPITWEQVMETLRSDLGRTYRIDVETDSTVAASIESDMSGMRDVLTAIVEFIQGIGPAVQAQAVPIEAVKEVVMTIARRARMGSAVEDAFDKMQAPQAQGGVDPKQYQQEKQQSQQQIQQLTQQLQQSQQQLQAEKQSQQANIAAANAQAQADQIIERIRQQGESQRAQQQALFDRWEALLSAQTTKEVAQINAGAKAEAAQVAAENKPEVSNG